MKRMIMLALAALALPLAAQQKAPAAPAPVVAPKQVAVINGEVVTADKLDYMWNNIGTAMRDQYEKAGGKPAFLENYLRKRLVIQEAMKSGFDKRPDVVADMNAASESALFDRYIRDVVAAPFVTEDEIHKYFEEHKQDFATPERIKVRHIVITANETGPGARSKEQALERIKVILADLMSRQMELRNIDPDGAARLRVIYFGDAARKYSEDASAPSGGDLGWKAKGELDPTFEEAAWGVRPGSMSGIVETKFGYHLVFVEQHEQPGTQPFAEVRPTVREFLLTQKATDVMTAVNKLTNELRMSSKVSVFPENIK